MKNFFLTLDLEEWYHLEYIKPFIDKIDLQIRFAKKTLPFLIKMAEMKIFMTVFVVADVAQENADLIRKIASLGHEIACHGESHELVYNLSNEEFRSMILNSKKILEDIIQKPVIGYRAPCFSMENEKLKILYDLDFIYDASLIKFEDHKLYNVMDMKAFNQIESLIYKKNNNYEFETPTVKIFGKSIPISGGGYFRLFPLWLTKLLMRKYWEKENNFIFYIHPFEVVGNQKLKISKTIGFKNYFRFQVGRKNMVKKLDKYIEWLNKKNLNFLTFSNYLKI